MASLFMKRKPKKRREQYASLAPGVLEWMRTGRLPVTLYDTALAMNAYGNPMMGDMFGDIMGAVIGKDNWDARPDWMKDIKVKPDPARLLKAAVKVVPPKMVGGVVRQANQYGFDLNYRTPAGFMNVTPETAEGVYGNYPAYLSTKDVFSNIPTWVYLVGATGIIFAFVIRKK